MSTAVGSRKCCPSLGKGLSHKLRLLALFFSTGQAQGSIWEGLRATQAASHGTGQEEGMAVDSVTEAEGHRLSAVED